MVRRVGCAFIFVCADEKEFIIDELTNIIKDQGYRMRDDLQDDYTAPRNRITPGADKQPAFVYDLTSDLPELNTGDQEIPFAVLPKDRRYYQPGRVG